MSIKSLLAFGMSIFLLLSACRETGSNATSSAEIDTLSQAETDAVLPEEDVQEENFSAFLKGIPEGASLAIEKKFLSKLDQLDVDQTSLMSTKTIRNLTVKLNPEAITQRGEFLINEAIGMDSIRKSGNLDAYRSGLDIGGTLKADAQLLKRIPFSPEQQMVLWRIHYSTYEACPYALGNLVYGTLFYKGKPGETALVGESLSQGDPPAGAEDYVYASLMGDVLTLTSEYIELEGTDTPDPTEHKTSNTVRYRLVNGTYEVIK